MELGAYPRLRPFSFPTYPRAISSLPFQGKKHRHRSSWLHLSSCPALPSILEPQLQGRTPFCYQEAMSQPWLNCWVPYHDLCSFGIDLIWAIGSEEIADRMYRKDGIRWSVCSDGDAPEAGNLVYLLHATERRGKLAGPGRGTL